MQWRVAEDRRNYKYRLLLPLIFYNVSSGYKESYISKMNIADMLNLSMIL